MRLYESERKEEILKIINDNNFPFQWKDGVDGGEVTVIPELILIPIWCNTHQRDYRRCLAREGGIMIPCKPLNCAEAGIEIWDDEYDFSFFDEKVLALDPKIPDADLVPLGGCTASEHNLESIEFNPLALDYMKQVRTESHG